MLLAVGTAAFTAEIPFFFFGIPSGHDVEFHLYSWLEVLAQWKHGIFFPRWAAMAQFGYGEPRFIFYPPASWILGALLSTVFPWKIASCVYIWLVLTLAGVSMYVLARRWFSYRDALFAGVFYAVNPYHLVIVYWRSAFAELLASCLVPLLLLLMMRVAEGERRVVVPLGIVLAAAWLTNAPAAVMIHYSLALLALIVAWQRRSLHVVWIAAGAVLLGASLAAFYLLPAIYEQKWVTIAEAVSQGSRPLDNFLFIHTTDPDHDKFNRIISWIAVWEMVVVAATLVTARLRRAFQDDIWGVYAMWAAACAVLMFPVTLVLWNHLPKLAFMQFPWRWMLCLSVVFTLLVMASLRRGWMRAAVMLVGIVLVAAAWNWIQPPWWDSAADMKEMQDNMADRVGYEGVDEYTPVGAEPSAIDKNAPLIVAAGPAQVKIQIAKWGAEEKIFTAEMPVPGQLALRLFSYPAWKVEVNGHVVQAMSREGSGQMLVPVDAGMNRVDVKFVRTWDRTVGGWISIITILVIAILWARTP